MDIKKKIYNFYYTIQIAYTVWGSIISSIGWLSVITLDAHFLLPGISAIYVSGLIAFIGIIFLYVFGFFFLKHGGYASSQTFGGNSNPYRVNWSSEIAKAKLMVAQTTAIKLIAANKKYDAESLNALLDGPTKEVETVQKVMEKLLA